MPLADVLTKAQRLVAGGAWSEPFTRDVEGRMCGPHAEDVHTYSLSDALAVCASSAEEAGAAWDTLEALVCPANPAFSQMADDFCAGRLPNLTGAEVKRLAGAACAETEASGMSLTDWLEHPRRSERELLVLLGRAAARSRLKGAR